MLITSYFFFISGFAIYSFYLVRILGRVFNNEFKSDTIFGGYILDSEMKYVNIATVLIAIAFALFLLA